MRVKTILLFLILVSPALALDCLKALRSVGVTEPFVQGTLDIPKPYQKRAADLKKRRNAKEVYFIEEGGEALIFRVVDADGSEHILRGRTDEWSNKFDVDFYQMAANFPQGGAHFKTPQNAKGLPGKWIEYDDVKGHELKSVLVKLKTIQPEVAHRLATLHNERMQNLVQQLKAKGWVTRSKWVKEHGFRVLQVSAAPTKEELNIRRDIFSSDLMNVIVDPVTMEMTYIDPG